MIDAVLRIWTIVGTVGECWIAVCIAALLISGLSRFFSWVNRLGEK